MNAFDYGDPAPSQDEKVACALEQAAHPFMQQRNLLRISMRTAAVGRAAGTPLRLTVLLDNSGSMERADRVESVQRRLRAARGAAAPGGRGDPDRLCADSRACCADSVPGDKAGELVKHRRGHPERGRHQPRGGPAAGAGEGAGAVPGGRAEPHHPADRRGGEPRQRRAGAAGAAGRADARRRGSPSMPAASARTD